MFDKLEEFIKRFDELTKMLMEPDVVNDQKRYQALMKEHKQITPVVEKYKEYKNVKQTITDSEEMIKAESDPELLEMAREELNEAKDKVPALEEELKNSEIDVYFYSKDDSELNKYLSHQNVKNFETVIEAYRLENDYDKFA